MKISGTTDANATGEYGKIETPHARNSPGSRIAAASWMDSKSNMYVFGGYGFGESGVGILNDLWRFDGERWAWISGPKNPNTIVSSFPNPRKSSTSWSSSSSLFLYGGVGSGGDAIDDFWEIEIEQVSQDTRSELSKRDVSPIYIGCFDSLPTARQFSGDIATCISQCSSINGTYLDKDLTFSCLYFCF